MGFPVESSWAALFIIGTEQIAVSTGVELLTVPEGAERAFISVTGTGAPTGVRVGTSTDLPTVSKGLFFPVNEPFPLPFVTLGDLRFIRDGAVDVTLDVVYVAAGPLTNVYGNWAPPS